VQRSSPTVGGQTLEKGQAQLVVLGDTLIGAQISVPSPAALLAAIYITYWVKNARDF
jgi:hypothetical protein